MNKKYIIFLALIFALIISIITFYYVKKINLKSYENNNQNIYSENENTTDEKDNGIVLDTKTNDMIISTKSNSTIRVINKYDKSMFKNKNAKTFLIMFGSWCSNCEKEFADIVKAVQYYKGSQEVNIILIAHEYYVEDLIEFLETSGYDFNSEIFMDLGRVIRRTIDPDEATVPVAYLLDKNGDIISKHKGALTFDKIKEIIKNTD